MYTHKQFDVVKKVVWKLVLINIGRSVEKWTIDSDLHQFSRYFFN